MTRADLERSHDLIIDAQWRCVGLATCAQRVRILRRAFSHITDAYYADLGESRPFHMESTPDA